MEGHRRNLRPDGDAVSKMKRGRGKLSGGLLVVLLVAGCHYAPDPEPMTAQQKLAMVEASRQNAIAFSKTMDELEAKMIAAGAYKPGEIREARNVYPEGHKSLGPIGD